MGASMIIGICGKSGSGKSFLAKSIGEHFNNAIHIDIDKIGHHALEDETIKEKLVMEFGDILKDNQIDRSILGNIVFKDKKKMKLLEFYTWEYMKNCTLEIINANKDKIIILDWILLSIVDLFKMCDIKILLDVSYDERIKRVLNRDNISIEKFAIREKGSIEYNEEDFDIVLGSLYDINKVIEKIKCI